jgi:predicted nucleic acid-binding Zn ribbon protein
MQARDYTVGAIPGRTPQEQLEVVLQQDGEGRWGLTLIAQGWGEGLGWYPQKTIALDASQIEPLQRMLAIVQGVTRRAQSRRDRDGERPQFPAPPSGEDRGLQCG